MTAQQGLKKHVLELNMREHVRHLEKVEEPRSSLSPKQNGVPSRRYQEGFGWMRLGLRLICLKAFVYTDTYIYIHTY